MKDVYLSIAQESKGTYKEKGSRFLAFAYPVANEFQVQEKRSALKKEYYYARHHCYAYILGADKNIYRANDDGEPNHSAGDPILGQIHSKNLADILIVVVRYFGGTKLGVGGLIHAYKTAAAEALENGFIIEHIIKKKLSVHFQYEHMSQVMGLVKEYNTDVIRQQFQESCQLDIEVRRSQLEEVTEKLKSIYGIRVF